MRQLRIGRPVELGKVSLEPAVTRAFDRAAKKLQSLGFTITNVVLGHDFAVVRRAGLLIAEAEGARFHAKARAEDPQGFSPEFCSLLDYGARQSQSRIESAYRLLAETQSTVAKIFKDVDVLILPTTPQAAFPFGSPIPTNQADLTGIANIAHGPSVCVPMGRNDDGMPLSIQFVGRPFDDRLVLALAKLYEAV